MRWRFGDLYADSRVRTVLTLVRGRPYANAFMLMPAFGSLCMDV